MGRLHIFILKFPHLNFLDPFEICSLLTLVFKNPTLRSCYNRLIVFLSSILGVRIAPEAATTKNTLITVSLEKFNGILVYAYCDNDLTFLKKILSSGPVWDHQFINATEVALLQAKGQKISKGNYGVFNLPKNQLISALASTKG